MNALRSLICRQTLSAFFLILTLPSIASADEWICKEASSQKRGTDFLVCGVGEAKSEADARIDALRDAAREFKELCSQSTDCRDYEPKVDPKRTDCEKSAKGYKCYRGFVYTLTDKTSNIGFLEYEKSLLDEEIKLNEEKVQQMREVKERQEKLNTLRKQIETGNVTETPSSTPSAPHAPFRGTQNGFAIGFNLLSLNSPAFAGESWFWSLGLSLHYNIQGYGDIEVGANINLPFNQYSIDQFGKASTVAKPWAQGSDYYLAVPLYLATYHNKNNSKTSAFFVAPEYRVYKYFSAVRKGVGVSFGWKTVGSYGASFRIGASNLVYSESIPGTASRAPVYTMDVSWPLIAL